MDPGGDAEMAKKKPTFEEIMALADTIGILYRGEMMRISPAGEMTVQEVGHCMMGVKEA